MPTDNNFPLNKDGKPAKIKEIIIKPSKPNKPTTISPTGDEDIGRIGGGSSGNGLSSNEIKDIADIAIKLFNSKKFPTLYDDDTIRENIKKNGPPSLRMSFQPKFDFAEATKDIAMNPTPLGIGIALAKQIVSYDMMGEVESQLANMRELQIYSEDKNREQSEIQQNEISNRQSQLDEMMNAQSEALRKHMESKSKVLNNGLNLQMQTKVRVLTGKKIEIPKINTPIDNLRVENYNENHFLTKVENKDEAIKIINTFNKSNKLGKWTKISKLEFTKELIDIVKNPSLINQANSNLCGIALPLKLFAEKFPEKFTNMAISFFVNGNYYDIDANLSLYEKKPPKNLSNVGFIMLSSLKNELNYVRFDPATDFGFSGMTTPWEFNKIMENWFGFVRTTNKYNGDLYEWTKNALMDNSKVCLLVNYNGFFKGSTLFNVPTHYIQIREIKKISNNRIFLKFWHWGIDTENKEFKSQLQIEIPISQLEKYTHFNGSWK